MSIPVPEHLVEEFKSNPNLEASWREQLNEHPNLGRTTWTKEQVEDLDRAHDRHIDVCFECSDGLDFTYGLYDESNPALGYCKEGAESLLSWLNAEHEYSWQPNFIG